MHRESLPAEQVLEVLASTPRRLAALTADLPPAELRGTTSDGEWSANEILAHLRACADVWGDCITAIVAGNAPTLRAVNPRTWIRQTDYRELDFQPSLQAFTVQRAALLAALHELTSEDWSRTTTVTGAGKALERTVLFYAQWLARHERPHIKQVERTVETTRAQGRSR